MQNLPIITSSAPFFFFCRRKQILNKKPVRLKTHLLARKKANNQIVRVVYKLTLLKLYIFYDISFSLRKQSQVMFDLVQTFKKFLAHQFYFNCWFSMQALFQQFFQLVATLAWSKSYFKQQCNNTKTRIQQKTLYILDPKLLYLQTALKNCILQSTVKQIFYWPVCNRSANSS